MLLPEDGPQIKNAEFPQYPGQVNSKPKQQSTLQSIQRID